MVDLHYEIIFDRDDFTELTALGNRIARKLLERSKPYILLYLADYTPRDTATKMMHATKGIDRKSTYMADFWHMDYDVENYGWSNKIRLTNSDKPLRYYKPTVQLNYDGNQPYGGGVITARGKFMFFWYRKAGMWMRRGFVGPNLSYRIPFRRTVLKAVRDGVLDGARELRI